MTEYKLPYRLGEKARKYHREYGYNYARAMMYVALNKIETELNVNSDGEGDVMVKYGLSGKTIASYSILSDDPTETETAEDQLEDLSRFVEELSRENEVWFVRVDADDIDSRGKRLVLEVLSGIGGVYLGEYHEEFYGTQMYFMYYSRNPVLAYVFQDDFHDAAEWLHR